MFQLGPFFPVEHIVPQNLPPYLSVYWVYTRLYPFLVTQMRAAHLGDSSLFIAHMRAVYPRSSSLCEHVVPGRLQPLSSPRWGLYCENLQLHSIPSSFILACGTFEGYMHGRLQARKVKHAWWALSCQHNASKKLQPHFLPWWPKQFWVALAYLIMSISTGCLGVPCSVYVLPRSLQTLSITQWGLYA